MQKCQKCSNQFTWKNIIKSIWLGGYKPIECDRCNTKHYVNMRTRLSVVCLSTGVPLIPVFTGTTRYIYSILGNYFLIVYLLWIALTIYITPFLATYHINSDL